MKIETELTIISGFVGFSLGVCIMMVINTNNKYKMYEQSIQLDSDTEFLIQENIGTYEDIIEWMKEDVFNEGDSTMYYIYIPKLQGMVDHNRKVLYTTSLEYYELDSDLSID